MRGTSDTYDGGSMRGSIQECVLTAVAPCESIAVPAAVHTAVDEHGARRISGILQVAPERQLEHTAEMRTHTTRPEEDRKVVLNRLLRYFALAYCTRLLYTAANAGERGIC